MNAYKHGTRPTIGVLAGWQFYEGNVHGFLKLVLRGVYSAAQDQDCNLLFACGLGHALGQMQGCPAWPVGSPDADFVPVGPWNTDGLIVINPLLNLERARYIQQIREDGHPVVFVGAAENGNIVVPDNESGIHQAVAHLVQHGHRRIVFVAGRYEEDGDAMKRLQAYRAAVREYGLDDDPNLIVFGAHLPYYSQQVMKQFLNSDVPFQAVLASNDYSALGAIHALQESGLRIPQDIPVIGFDDLLEVATQEPPLTTIHYPVVEAGRKALTLLLETIRDQREEDQVTLLPVNLVIRESCGCNPGHLSVPSSQARTESTHAKGILHLLVEAVSRESHFLDSRETEILCGQLVEAFVCSLREGEPAAFHTVLKSILQRIGDLDDNLNVWHLALSLLRQGVPSFLENPDDFQLKQVETMLDQGRVDISLSASKKYVHYVSNRGYIAEEIGLLTSRLFTSVDNQQLFEILGETLPKVDIRRADIGFFEMENGDAVARTRLYPVPGLDPAPVCFPSRQFPPDGLYSSDVPFHLALFPLTYQNQEDGFIAFDASDLGTCVTVTRLLTAAFRSVRLYHEAAEGRLQAEAGRLLAEEADLMKSRFLASVSHELRTPLNLIVGLSEMLMDGHGGGSDSSSQDAYQKDVAQIHSSAQHLGWLIRDVLDLASSQAGQLRLTNGPVDMNQVLDVVAAAGEQLTSEKGLTWTVDVPPNLPCLWGDQTRLTQVGLNLVSNAVKFTEEGGVSLRVKVEGKTLLVEVSDTGLGIPVEEQQLIFNEFRQSERTSRRGYGGLGLGLAICKRLVELHGGEIGVHSGDEMNSGSTFYFRLPTQQDVLADVDGPPRTAVVVVDRLEQGERLCAHLEREGYIVEVCLADAGSEWLAGVLSRAPQAVVLDAEVAARQGWEVLKALKSNPLTQATPVLFYKLQGGSGSMLSLDYLSKPLNPQTLTAALELRGLSVAGETVRSVLVVDDEPGILEMHARVVAELGADYRVLKAQNGREALELIQEKRPDLVLLDLAMPELDGFGVLEAMQAGETTRDIPVIVLTAQVLTEADMARLNRGVEAVLQKGIFSIQETLGHIETALAHLPKLNSGMQKVVRKALVYIHEYYAGSYSRKELARQVGVSEQYLTRCFRKELGITPIEYLNRYRVKKAKAMLESGKSVTETAFEVGFSSVSNFTKFFHKEMGMSPIAYRRGQPKE